MSILLEGLRKAFGPKVILDGVDLEVHEGETMAVIGGSGVGKSVLLKTIVGLLKPDAGRVVVDDEVVTELGREELYGLRRRVGYVFQFAALFDSMTVGENLAMGLKRMRDLDDAERDRRTAEALRLVELEGYEDQYPGQMSGGQRKRVGLARAVVTRPKYLLYDEPTTGLDPLTTAVIDRLILKMDQELGVTSVVVTHDMDSAYRVADRVALLYDGRIRFVGTPAEIQAAEDPIVRGFIEGRPELMQGAVT
ncbi:MAG TPA: ATP-binding cassette domain-containing protein [Longimicrobiales bacterium]|nr:ATP-binding cassette domain-containing protein [Longimicrobiales bacterium]